nr:phenylalanine--tRNA ligase beta subunit-like [Nerophis lumbriciformis]
MIRNVTVGPSPAWLVERLEAIGSRSINNVVDITNYVLWETGQPLHAFDYERLGGAEIRVRRARAGEQLKTLDGVEHKLDEEILVIADAEQPVALAGVMGGFDSEVTKSTTTVLLESAHFDPHTVRRGAKKLGLHTDASHRFERGADPLACLWAAQRAAALIAELAGGEILAGEVDPQELDPAWPPAIEIDQHRLAAFGGVDIEAAEIETTLGGLVFELTSTGAARWQVTPPSWRWYDFENPYPADVYEELLRIHGFDEIASTLPQVAGLDAAEGPGHRLRRRIQDHLAACGFAEAIDYAFHDQASDDAFPGLLADAEALRLANPLSDRYAVMRRSIAHVFAAGAADAEPVAGVREIETLALVAGGSSNSAWERPAQIDFFDLKGVVDSLASSLGVTLEARPAKRPNLVPGHTADLFLASDSLSSDEIRRPVGYLGQLEEEGPWPLLVAELACEALLGEDEGALTIEIPSKLPGISADTTLTHSLEVAWAEIAQAIESEQVADLLAFGLKDLYSGKGVPAGAANTTIWFRYGSHERSLTQEEINERHQQLAAMLEKRFGSGR